MGKKSGIATYGYRDQNEFLSSVGLVCEAIAHSGSGSDKDIIKQLVESVNLIFNKAIVDAAYNKDNKEFEFNNYYGAEVDRFKFPYVVNTAEYDEDAKKIIITFIDETVEPIEIDLSSIGDASVIEARLEEEISARIEADQEILASIAELSSSTEELSTLINDEVSARTNGDESLSERLYQEISTRQEDDSALSGAIDTERAEREADVEELWDAITSGSSIIEIINNEISARTEADEELWGAVNELAESANTISNAIQNEISARTEADEELTNNLTEEANARSEADTNLSNIIAQETSDRENADEALGENLSAETEARISGDTELLQKISDEKAARVYWFGVLSGAVSTERTERENSDAELLEMLNVEIETRASEISSISGSIDTEINARIENDETLSGAIDTEKEERESADEALSGVIDTEINERISNDNYISGAVDTEISQRISNDELLSGAILDNQVHVERITDPSELGSNVREEYVVVNAIGEVLGQHIKIYKDSTLQGVELTDHDDQGNIGQFLKFTYITATGVAEDIYVNVSNFLVEAEFKDGLIVNRSGEVSVLIDRASDDYLTVSSEGLRLSGISEMAQTLETEITSRIAKDEILEANIATEAANRETADVNLSTRIDNEEDAREVGDDELRSLISQESARATDAENSLSSSLSSETVIRTEQYQTLSSNYITLLNRISTEEDNRASGDASLQRNLTNKDRELNNKINTLTSRIQAEEENRADADSNLQNSINLKANSVDVYYKSQVDELFAKKEEIPSDFYSKSEVDTKDNEIKTLITTEVTTREREDADLTRAISGEVQRAISAEDILSSAIDTINTELSGKVEDISSDLTINVDKTDAVRPELSVKISSSENQIITVNADGLYAKSTLGYDEEHNTLIYTNTTGTTTIPLKTKSEIDNIYYDKTNEEIVIEYTVNGSRKEDARVSVHDLIQEWIVEDGNPNAIALTKDVSVPNADVLRASLVLNTTHADNAAVIDDNALYVSKDAIISGATAEIEALKARVTALENALARTNDLDLEQTTRISAIEVKNNTQDDEIAQLQNYIN